MALGLIDQQVLADIANAIREQNGAHATYKPSEMAAAVLALDGTKDGIGDKAVLPSLVGLVNGSAFQAIADAIRSQNGLSTKYKPGEMGDAIRALEWDTGVKARALLLSDGTLELNYRDGRSSDVSGASIVKAFEVDAAGYARASARPWHDDKLDVRKVLIDADFSGAGLTDASYLFSGFTNLVEVRGFENMQGIVKATQMFESCSSLETIYATSFDNSALASASMAFYGCPRLVGSTGYVPENTDGASAFAISAMGVLVDPAADARQWVYANLYDDGELVVRSEEGAEAGRGVLASGRLCCQAMYDAVGMQPWRDVRDKLLTATFALTLSYELLNLQYWFYGCAKLATVTGLTTLSGLYRLDYAFTSCTSLTVFDLRGADWTGVYSLYQTFGGCTALTTIYLDEGWTSPCNSSSTFYNCPSLVGGNGTTYDSSRVTSTYLRPDTVTKPGYGTVG